MVWLAAGGGVTIAYLISLGIFPWRSCKKCDGRGKLQDPVFRGAHRDCPKCEGAGRYHRTGRRLWARMDGRKVPSPAKPWWRKLM